MYNFEAVKHDTLTNVGLMLAHRLQRWANYSQGKDSCFLGIPQQSGKTVLPFEK